MKKSMESSEKIKPVVALIGKPNVGKSTLFNRMTGKNIAIVEDRPGVTRDVNYQDVSYDNVIFTLVDTGGFFPDRADDIIMSEISKHIQLLISEVNALIFLVDAKSGPSELDRDIYLFLKRQNIPVWVAATHIDSDAHESRLNDCYGLGTDVIYPISSVNNRGLEELFDDVTRDFPTVDELEDSAVEDDVRVAVTGRPNTGKSTLVNKLIGEKKMLVTPMAGTTVDSIDTLFDFEGKRIRIIDTAGIRRKKKVHAFMEKISILRAFKSMDRADVVVVMMDSQAAASRQDLRILGMAHEKYKGVVITLNKWDLIKKETKLYDEFVKEIRKRCKFASYMPVISISAEKGRRTEKLLKMVCRVAENTKKKVGDDILREWMNKAVIRRPPARTQKYRENNFYSVKMMPGKPPTVVFRVKDPKSVHFSYERYLTNQFRRSFDFEGVRVKFKFIKKDDRYDE
ncbi:MAG: ribosome biogenesis GTPase Der [bacterium]